MRKKYSYVLIFSFLLAACSQGGGSKNNEQDSTAKSSEVSAASIPGIDKVPLTDSIVLKATDDMHFDKDLFKIKSGKKIVLVLKNVGAQTKMPMAHNVLVLNKGTDLSDFAEEAKRFKTQDYIPSTLASSIIAHINMVSAGKSGETNFTISQPGVYNFICSYPGHWGTMQGQIVVLKSPL